MQEAAVVCREMNCGAPLAVKYRAYFGEGDDHVWMDDVECIGNEKSLTDCPHRGFGENDCGHSEDAGVVCSDTIRLVNGTDRCSGRLEIHHEGQWGKICNPEIRLVNGTDHCSGRVEIQHDGQWGTVCDDQWDLKDAQVVCRALDCGTPQTAKSAAFFGQGLGEIWLDDVECLGNETSLLHCQHSSFGDNNCGHSEDAGVVCSSNVRLVNGSSRCAGRVEFYHNGQWGTVCGDSWDVNDAKVVCSQLNCGLVHKINHMGYFGHDGLAVRLVNSVDQCSGRVEVRYADEWGTLCDRDWTMKDAETVCKLLDCGNAVSAPGGARFGQGTGPIWEASDSCFANETSLEQCSLKGFTRTRCGHEEDAGIVCAAQLRLVNGNSECSGRVEIFHDGQWGTVCDDEWEMTNAAVVCRQLGCGHAVGALSGAHFGRGSGPIWLDNVECTGEESALTQCSHPTFGENNCGHGEDAGVICLGHSDRDYNTLVNEYGNGRSLQDKGALAETSHRRIPRPPGTRWNFRSRTVNAVWESRDEILECLDNMRTQPGWDRVTISEAYGLSMHLRDPTFLQLLQFFSEVMAEVDVLYSKLQKREIHASGVNRAVEIFKAKVKETRGRADVIANQTGEEGTVTAKRRKMNTAAVMKEACDTMVVQVKDRFSKSNPEIRLVNGTDHCSGRVEIQHDGQWGTVCSNYWDLKDAQVVCRELDCGTPQTVNHFAFFGQGLGEIWLDLFQCLGNVRLVNGSSRCAGRVEFYHNGQWGTVCGDSWDVNDAKVVCSQLNCGLVNKINHMGYFGHGKGKIVEIFHDGQWGTVCDDEWEMTNAAVVCRQLGCGHAVGAPTIAHFGRGSGPIWLDNVECTGEESALTQCSHAAFGETDCGHGRDAGVICLGKQYDFC
ncbi:scavenger receptor cysteine-rich domain-containing protein DMBT1-like [Diretmus argenteus]